MRGDTFVVETNIHYPTESSVIGDGLRKIVHLAAELAATNALDGWRQAKHLLKKYAGWCGRLVELHAEGPRADRLQPGYQKLVGLAEDLWSGLGSYCGACVQAGPDDVRVGEREERHGVVATPEVESLGFIVLTEKVCDNARRRVLQGETLANEEKIHSIFEPHTELIKRGKQPNPIEFGHKVLVIEDAAGFVMDFRVVEDGVLDQTWSCR